MTPTKLIVVCDEKRLDMGNYLSQLLSSNDDEENRAVGVKDGSVTCLIWAEKDYIANSATVSSNQYILFIGNSKFIKEKTKFMKTIFSEYGIVYKSLGKQAAIIVEKIVPAKEYEAFFEKAKKYTEDLKQLVKNKGKSEKGIAAAVIAGSLAIPSPVGLVASSAVAIKQVFKSKKIEEQMFNYGVIKFYLEEATAFLGLKANDDKQE